MYCDFLDYKWGWYCKKEGKTVYKDTVNTYCDNSLNFRNCPIYKKSDSTGCYLTTCMCEVLGKEDDCEELETLRKFRDGYMKQDERFTPLLEDYDKVGPIISDKILDDENCQDVANIMKNHYIDRAISHIKEKEYDEAVNVYIDMTLSLMDNYNISQDILNKDSYNLNKGKARTRK